MCKLPQQLDWRENSRMLEITCKIIIISILPRESGRIYCFTNAVMLFHNVSQITGYPITSLKTSLHSTWSSTVVGARLWICCDSGTVWSILCCRYSVRSLIERGAETPKQQEEYHACLAESDELDIELTQLTIAKDTKDSRARRVCSTGVVCMYTQSYVHY